MAERGTSIFQEWPPGMPHAAHLPQLAGRRSSKQRGARDCDLLSRALIPPEARVMGFSGPHFPMNCLDNFLHFGILHQRPYPHQYPLTQGGRMALEIKKPRYLQEKEWLL